MDINARHGDANVPAEKKLYAQPVGFATETLKAADVIGLIVLESPVLHTTYRKKSYTMFIKDLSTDVTIKMTCHTTTMEAGG